MNFQQHLECFNKVLDNFHIAELLRKDRCGALCDKYHIAIVFQFFMRADFREKDYTPRNFFLALTLSHDLYEESKVLKQIILTYYLNRNDGFKNKTKIAFHWDKLVLFKRMQFKGLVLRKICKKLCQLGSHKAFDRTRKELHAGYITNKILCDKCLCPMNKSFSMDTQDSDTTDEKSDQSKTSCNSRDVSLTTTEQRAKKPRKNRTEMAKNQFFRDCEPELFSVEKKSVTYTC